MDDPKKPNSPFDIAKKEFEKHFREIKEKYPDAVFIDKEPIVIHLPPGEGLRIKKESD